jgi:two-component sensor histidine kinase
LHPEQQARLVALRGYNILDSASEDDFDEIVRIVGEICGMPVALVSLVDEDRQWFKAKSGLEITQTPIEAAVCAHGILQPDVLEIGDLTKDVRTIDNPIVTGGPAFRFYAGAALTNKDGLPLGMLCVLDYQPRELTPAQRDLLRVMAKLVMERIELRRALAQEKAAHAQVQDILEKANALLERNSTLRREIDHRVKNSLTQVTSFLRLQERAYKDDPRIVGALAEARYRVTTVATVHDHLHHAVDDDTARADQFLTNLVGELSKNRPMHLKSIDVDADATRLTSDRVMALGLTVNEIISNAIKHAFAPGDAGVIKVSFRTLDGESMLRISDNGKGLPENFAASQSTGLGMRVVNGTAQQLGGTLAFESGIGGTTFTVRFPATR